MILLGLKKEGNHSCSIARMNLENVMLNAIRATEKDKYCVISLL